MSYENFADQFWPILGQRVYECDAGTAEQVFERARAICSEPDEVSLLTQGEG